MKLEIQDIGLNPDTEKMLWASGVTCFSDLINQGKEEILAMSGLTESILKDLQKKTRVMGISVAEGVSLKQRGSGKGRSLGSKDKNPGSVARSKAGRKNSWKTGKGSHSDHGNSITLSEFSFDKTDIKRSGKLFRDALTGKYEDLEEDLCNTLGEMYVLYKSLLQEIVARGQVDIPVFVVSCDGVILRDVQGEKIVRSLKTPKGTLELMENLRTALGLGVNEMNLTAKAQGRTPAVSNKTTLDDVQSGMDEIRKNRERFKKVA